PDAVPRALVHSEPRRLRRWTREPRTARRRFCPESRSHRARAPRAPGATRFTPARPPHARARHRRCVGHRWRGRISEHRRRRARRVCAPQRRLAASARQRRVRTAAVLHHTRRARGHLPRDRALPRAAMIRLGVTGTDTGVGKTTIGRALLGLLRADGLRVAAMKPVETGVTAEDPTSDARALAAAAGAAASMLDVCPIVLAEPLAPWMAARRAGRTLTMTSLDESFHRLAQRVDAILVEGA